MKYRKKPVVIEAFRWNCDYTHADAPGWITEAIKFNKIYFDAFGGMFIRTPEGDHCAREGDYIIQGIKGELYPCKPDIFEMTYEIVE